MNSLVFIDIETTGLSPKDGKEIIEIAALKCDTEMCHPYSQFRTMIYPKNGIDPKAQEKNGITLGMVKYAHHIDDALHDFFVYIKPGDKLIGHNIKRFDIPFIEFYKGEPITNELIDTLLLAKELGFKQGCLKLEELAAHFKIEYKSAAHRALADVEVNRQVYKNLMSMKQNRLF